MKSGEHVRLSKWKSVFEKGYTPNWTEEIFKVLRKAPIHGRVGNVYKLVDWSGEPVEGKFYTKEVQKIHPTDHFIIDKIIAKRKVGRKPNKRSECLVHWLGWPDKYDTWIPESEVKDIVNQ